MSANASYKLAWRGSEFGPFSLADIRHQLATGELNSMYQILVDGRWVILRDFLESEAVRRAAIPTAPTQPAIPTPPGRQAETQAARDADTWGIPQAASAKAEPPPPTLIPPPYPAQVVTPSAISSVRLYGRESSRSSFWTWAAVAVVLMLVGAGAWMYIKRDSGTAEVEDSVTDTVADTTLDTTKLDLQKAIRLFIGQEITQDKTAAAVIFKRYAEEGNPIGQLYYGYALYDSKGAAAAVPWVEKSAQQGVAESQYLLGMSYLTGEGVPKDSAKAIEWLTKAAMMGNCKAQCYLGYCYASGTGCKADLVQSYAWLEVSGAGRNPEINEVMELLTSQMTRVQITEAFRIVQELKSKMLTEPGVQGMPELITSANSRGNGTGFFITSDGYLVTNHHVVDKASVVKVMTPKGIQNATIVETDPVNDLALLKLTGKFDYVPIVSSKDMVLGRTVATVGFPTINVLGVSPKLGKGEVTALTGIGNSQHLFQISVPIHPGNSGGGLVDERGNVVGVIVAKLDAEAMVKASGALPENINYAVKSALVLDLVKRVPGLTEQLPKAHKGERKFETVVKELQKASVMILLF